MQPFLPQTANVLAEALAAAADPTAQSIDGLLDMLYALGAMLAFTTSNMSGTGSKLLADAM